MIFSKKNSMNWNEITQGIDHISGKDIRIDTKPIMKVDIDGEIRLEAPLDIKVLPKALKLLTILHKIDKQFGT